MAAEQMVFYHYAPSLPAAIVVAVLFTSAFIATVVQFMRYRSWVWTAMIVAAGSELPSIQVCGLRTFVLMINSGVCWLYPPMSLNSKPNQQEPLCLVFFADHPGTCAHGSGLLYCVRKDRISRGPEGESNCATTLGSSSLCYTHLRRLRYSCVVSPTYWRCRNHDCQCRYF